MQSVTTPRKNYDVKVGCTSGVCYVTSDPIGLSGGINAYGYVLGNSLKYIDPLGLLSKNIYDALTKINNQNDPLIHNYDPFYDRAREQGVLERANVKYTVDGVDLQYTIATLGFANRTNGGGLLPTIIFFGFYSPIGSAVSARNNGIDFNGWLYDTSADLNGVNLGRDIWLAGGLSNYLDKYSGCNQ